MSEFTTTQCGIMLDGLTDAQKNLFFSCYNGAKKDRFLALILSIFLGTFGIDRFYTGDIGLGLLKLLTGGLFGILWVLDWFLILWRVDSYNRQKAEEIQMMLRQNADPAQRG